MSPLAGAGGWDQGHDPRRQIQLREALGQQALNLPPGPVRRGRQQLVHVVRRQSPRQQHHRRHMQPAVDQHVVDDREAPGRAGRSDALEGHILGHVQLVYAVEMHVRIAGRRVEPSGVELRNMRQQLGGRRAVARHQSGEIPGQGAVAQVREPVLVHDTTPRGRVAAGARLYS
jgi:hypothetical protein